VVLTRPGHIDCCEYHYDLNQNTVFTWSVRNLSVHQNVGRYILKHSFGAQFATKERHGGEDGGNTTVIGTMAAVFPQECR